MKKFVNILRQTDIFDQFTQSQLELVATICQEKSYRAGDIIVLEGTQGDELFIIAQGFVDVQVNPALIGRTNENAPPPSTIATLRRGQSFGEISLVDEGLRSASVIAMEENTRVLVLNRGQLLQICEDYPQLGYRLMYNLAADLALKMRGAGLQIRENLLYGDSKN